MVNPAAAIALLFTNVLLSIDDMNLRLIIDMIDRYEGIEPICKNSCFAYRYYSANV
jgi:hypothetical protein